MRRSGIVGRRTCAAAHQRGALAQQSHRSPGARRASGSRLSDPQRGAGSPRRLIQRKGSLVARKGDFTEILLRKRVISQDQLNEARQVSKDQNTSLPDTIIKLGYASGEDVMRAVAQEHGRDYVALNEVTIPEAIIELVPESVARENAILPLAEEDDALKVIVSDPYDIDTVEKLRFILNRRIEIALAPRDKILEAINKYYSQIEGESADSVLQEFTDTKIDFTETETTTQSIGAAEVVDENSAPIVRLVQLMIQEAVQLRASDIHVEPFEEI